MTIAGWGRGEGVVRRFAALAWLIAIAAAPVVASAAAPVGQSGEILTVYAAGTLAVPFKRVDAAFEKLHAGVVVRPQFGGSVMMARRIADLHQHADVYASADYAVIQEVLGKAGLSSWFVGFASNAVTLAYTARSRGAKHINSDNWYRVIAQPGVVIGRSNPDTDPSGYQFLQMLSLAANYYGKPNLKRKVLKNAPPEAMRPTETSLISALQLGQIDYLAIYSSSAEVHHLKYLRLPTAINLEDPSMYHAYAQGHAKTKKGILHGKPIIYAATVTGSSDHPKLAAEYIRFLIGKQGRTILAESGLMPLKKAYEYGASKAPELLKTSVKPWPKGLTVSE